MSDLAETAKCTQCFNEAVRNFKLPSPSRHAKLMPLKDGIVELRQKGASLRLIRELLATVDVAVGTDTIARFLAEVNGEQLPRRTSKRFRRRRAAVPVPTASTAITSPTPQAIIFKVNADIKHRCATGAFPHTGSTHRRSSQPLIQRSFL